VTTVAGDDERRNEFVLMRCRIGVRLPTGHSGTDFETALSAAIAIAAEDLGATVELLQLAVAADPSWGLAGPPNRS
jgi:hypothetical protein